jgi:hypothetical protein
LAEHHYAEPCVDESGSEAADYGKRFLERMHGALNCFFESPELDGARKADPRDTLACEDMSTFDLFGTKIYAVPDLAYRDGEGRVQILDWKTGSPREADRFQLAIYAFYARDKWGVEPTEVICKDVYLGRNEIVEQAYDSDQLDEVMGRIEESMTQMRGLHFDADAGVGQVEDFPMTTEDEEGLQECRSCNYRELCARP